MKYLNLACLLAAMSVGNAASATLTPVLLYDADNGSGAGTAGNLAAGTAILDQSSAGNDGTVGSGNGSFSATGPGIDTVEDDPNGVAGELSFSFTGGNRINTDNIDLLTDTLIAANGGYTMETWIKASANGTTQTFLSFAGTEGLTLRDDQLESFHHRGGSILSIGAPGLVTDGEWHHVVLRFNTSGDLDGTAGSTDLIGNLVGNVSAIVDGVPISTGSVGIGTFGDSLNRSIGVGGHPQGFGTLDFTGLLYNPSVSLGVVPEPSTLLLAFGALATIACSRRK